MVNIDLRSMTAVEMGTTGNLGHLFWYSIGKQLIKREDLLDLIKNVGIDESFAPKEIRVVDAYRRATKESECKRETSKIGVYKNYIIREVFSDTETVQRNIVVETVDQTGKRLDYNPQAGVITLHKANGTLTTTAESQQDATILSMIQDINEKFHSYKDFHSSQHLRVMVMGILKSLAPTPVRENGGIYFVPESQTEGLVKLCQLCAGLSNSEGYKIPVVDTADNKNMINKKLIDQADEILLAAENGQSLRKSQLKDLITLTNQTIEGYKAYREDMFADKEELETKILEAKAAAQRLLANVEMK